MKQELLEEIKEHINYFPRKEQSILLCLHAIQKHEGIISEDSLVKLSEMLELPLNYVKSVVAFYDMFDTKDKARHRIYVCDSIVCHIIGSSSLIATFEKLLGIKEGEVTNDNRFKLVKVQCLGACSSGPVFMIDEDLYKFENEVKLYEILSKYS